MDKEVFKKKIFMSKVKDYSYAIIFFITFSFFIFFVIRPNIVNVFSLQEELGRLKILDAGYENVIKKIVDIQFFLESNRSDLYLLDQALPQTPQINKVVQDLEKIASESGVKIIQIDINKINLKENTKKTKQTPLAVNLGLKSTFYQYKTFLKGIQEQRRLKSFKHIIIDKEQNEGTLSGQLNIKMQLEGYFL